MTADERAQRLAGSVNGTIVMAGVLTAVSAESHPKVFAAGAYAFATVFVFWLAHGWARALGLRHAGHPEHSFRHGLRHELPVLESVVPPLAALAIGAVLLSDPEDVIAVAGWVCVAELGLVGAGVARREGAPPLRIATAAVGCAALGMAMIGLKAVVH